MASERNVLDVTVKVQQRWWFKMLLFVLSFLLSWQFIEVDTASHILTKTINKGIRLKIGNGEWQPLKIDKVELTDEE